MGTVDTEQVVRMVRMDTDKNGLIKRLHTQMQAHFFWCITCFNEIYCLFVHAFLLSLDHDSYIAATTKMIIF